MIRVAQVIETIGRGGAERLLVDVTRHIDRSRFRTHVYTLFREPRTYAQTLEQLAVPESCLELEGMRQLPRGVARLCELLRRDCVDVVHTHLFGANVVGRLAARALGMPVLSSLHDADYEPVVREGNRSLTRWKQRVLQVLDRLTIALSHAEVVAVSEYVAASARRRLSISNTRLHVVHNAIDTDVFSPAVKGGRGRVRRALGLPERDGVVISVGRMTLQKNQRALLEALRELRERGLFPWLLLVGEGPERPGCEKRAEELGIQNRVRFLGDRADVPALIGAADVLALPSLHEGFGLVLVEALSCSVPVVASRTGPVAEIVQDGVTGLLVEPQSGEFASGLEALLVGHERRMRMGEAGRRDVELRFAMPVMLRRYEALYERAASHRRPSVQLG